MSAAPLVLAFLAPLAPFAPFTPGAGVQEPPQQAPPALADPRLDSELISALRRDPRSLPCAPEGRWKDFGESRSDPAPFPAEMARAVLAIRDRDLPRALAVLYRILDAEPAFHDYPPALYEMGVVYFRLQRYGDAAAALERFLAVAPAKVGETRALGHCYYSLGEYARAKAHYERVLAAAPDEVEALRGLALSEMHLGEPKKCLDLLGRVLELEPGHAEAWTWKAQVLYDQDRAEEALAAAERARDLAPWQPRPWFLVGRILLDLDREDDGLAAQARYRELSIADQEVRSIESRLEHRPRDTASLVRLAELHRSTGNLPGARDTLARLVKQKPADVELRILALDVLEGMGDGEGARVAARALEQRCAGEWKAWQRLERYYTRTGEALEQSRAAERLRRLRPGERRPSPR